MKEFIAIFVISCGLLGCKYHNLEIENKRKYEVSRMQEKTIQI